MVMETKKFFICPNCKEKSFFVVKKEFDGFKVREKKQVCALCGYSFKEGEEMRFIKEKQLFDDTDKQKNFCKDCRHYVMHPWTQKCMHKNIEVTALDSCEEFEKKEKEMD